MHGGSTLGSRPGEVLAQEGGRVRLIGDGKQQRPDSDPAAASPIITAARSEGVGMGHRLLGACDSSEQRWPHREGEADERNRDLQGNRESDGQTPLIQENERSRSAEP
jgi:hypothetical protein